MAGQPYFADLGLHHLGHRWYRPSWGRFLTSDPLGFPDGPNAFAFVGGQPLIYGDPHGLAKQGLLRALPALSRERIMDFINGAVDGINVNPFATPIGVQHGEAFSYHLGLLGGSGLGFFVDAGSIGTGTGLALGGGALTVGTGSTLGFVGVPVAAIGVGAAVAGTVEAASHAARLTKATAYFMNSESDGASPSVKSSGPAASSSEGPWGPELDWMPEFGVGPQLPDYRSGHTPLREFHMDRFGAFNTPKRSGDALEGHELLQNAWLKVHGHAEVRGQGAASLDNPAIALNNDLHKQITVRQRELGLFNPERLRSMSAQRNIEINVEVMREVGVPEFVVRQLEKQALSHASSLVP